MNAATFEELTDYELLAVSGGSPSIWTKIFSAIGGGAAYAIDGFVSGCENLADTCYNAGHQLGSYIRQF